MTPRRRTIVWSVARHLLLLCGAAFILLPFLWMISTASKPQTEIFTTRHPLHPAQLRAVG